MEFLTVCFAAISGQFKSVKLFVIVFNFVEYYKNLFSKLNSHIDIIKLMIINKLTLFRKVHFQFSKKRFLCNKAEKKPE